jgi:hypothetical protein
MTIVNAAHVTVEGTIEAQNKTGVKINGDWLNLSKYRPLELPASGARVRAEVDARGYLCSLEVLDSAVPTVLSRETPTVLSRAERNETITRLAVLKAAANFLGLMSQCREEVRSEHVLVLADKWLTWVNQPETH